MVIHAPFRFAPIPRWVYFPGWGDLVTHDVPFKDGLCGEIAIEIEAKTPLLIGGRRRKAEADQAGEVWPFVTRRRKGSQDGAEPSEEIYAIPSSTLQGMVRSILEIAAFGKLGPWIENQRYGIRDLAPAARPHYQRRLLEPGYNRTLRVPVVEPRVETGWLRKENGKYRLQLCDHARIQYDDVEKYTSATVAKHLSLKSDVQFRYQSAIGDASTLHSTFWTERSKSGHLHRNDRLEIHYRLAQKVNPHNSSWEQRDGWIVLTGNPGTNKHLEFIFLDPKPGSQLAEIEITDKQFGEFLAIHEPADGRDANENWRFFKTSGYPESGSFSDGGRMPVFYLPDRAGGVESFGLAFMFKLAHKWTTHEVLSSSDPNHLLGVASSSVHHPGPDSFDLPSLMFGAVNDDDGLSGLKRRASFDMATLTNDPHVISKGPAVLLSPKPNYYPSYIRQRPSDQEGRLHTITIDNNGRPIYAPYATYSPIDTPLERNDDFRKREHTSPTLAGVKVWPSRNRVTDPLKMCPAQIAGEAKLQTKLNALDQGALFLSTIRFHNVRPAELGALLWALTFGDSTAWTPNHDIPRRHRLGMGKPYGLGEVAIRIINFRVAANDGSVYSSLEDCGTFIKCFEAAMNGAYTARAAKGSQTDVEWRNCIQVQTLLNVSDPAFGRSQDHVVEKRLRHRSNFKRLDYMELNPDQHGGWNDFTAAKADGWFLPLYGNGHELQPEQTIAPPITSRPESTRPSSGHPAAQSARTRGAPVPSITRDPVLGDSVEVGTRIGKVIELPKDKRSPRWLVDFGDGNKPQSFARSIIKILP